MTCETNYFKNVLILYTRGLRPYVKYLLKVEHLKSHISRKFSPLTENSEELNKKPCRDISENSDYRVGQQWQSVFLSDVVSFSKDKKSDDPVSKTGLSWGVKYTLTAKSSTGPVLKNQHLPYSVCWHLEKHHPHQPLPGTRFAKYLCKISSILFTLRLIPAVPHWAAGRAVFVLSHPLFHLKQRPNTVQSAANISWSTAYECE